MKRFFERIRQKAVDVSQPPVLIVAFGDSVTQGAMELGRFDSEEVYHQQFQRKLESFYPATTFSTINAGVSGSSAKDAMDRVPRDITRHQPDLVLVAFGLNDCLGGLEALEGFGNTLRELVTGVRKNTEADVVLMTPPFMATRRNNRIHAEHHDCADGIILRQNDGTLARYAEAIREIAHEKETALADVHAEWGRLQEGGVDTDSLICNGLNHPDERGHALAAAVLFRAIFSFAPVSPH
jgi:acyl-CoA thioesterase-1